MQDALSELYPADLSDSLPQLAAPRTTLGVPRRRDQPGRIRPGAAANADTSKLPAADGAAAEAANAQGVVGLPAGQAATAADPPGAIASNPAEAAKTLGANRSGALGATATGSKPLPKDGTPAEHHPAAFGRPTASSLAFQKPADAASTVQVLSPPRKQRRARLFESTQTEYVKIPPPPPDAAEGKSRGAKKARHNFNKTGVTTYTTLDASQSQFMPWLGSIGALARAYT